MDGQALYALYESASGQFDDPWERLDQKQRETWDRFAFKIEHEWYGDDE